MTTSDAVVIVGAARTPMGGFLGDLKDVSAPALGARAISAAVERAGIAADSVDEILMGCVLPAGQGQAPARQAAIGAGLPLAAGATTINKMCGSGMKAAMVANDLLRARSADVVVAGGMESMSNAPYLLDRARSGYRMGHGRMIDHMFLDGLEDAYDKGRLMGTFAEDCAQNYQFTRAEQDAYALASLERANRAIKQGDFAWEIAPVSVKAGKSETLAQTDEQPPKARPEKIPTLKPAFRDGGTVTAANSSSISDGAAALVMMREFEAEKTGRSAARPGRRAFDPRRSSRKTFRPRRSAPCASSSTRPAGARIPSIFTRSTKPSRSSPWRRCAISACRTKRSTSTAAPARSAIRSAPRARAFSSPSSARCARVGLKRGVASLCIGGGEATAMAIETA